VTLEYFVLSPVLAALLSFMLTPWVRRLAVHIGAVDRPGPRKVHSSEVPRLGGLAVVASGAIVAALLFWSAPPQVGRIADDIALGLTFGLLPILICSIADDVHPLRALPKFAAQLAGAALAVGFGIHLGEQVHLFGQTIDLGWFAIPISLLWLVGITNAFNIVDGLDGLSAGLALVSALSLAGAAVFVGQYGLAMLALILAGALAGFLPYNIYPARIFLGDSGATAIGFTLGCLALRGGSTLSAGLAILGPIMVLGLPIAETLVSMARRFVRGLRSGGQMGVFEADAGHFHHRLLALGFDKRRVVLILYGVGLTLALTGYLSLFLTHKKAAVLLLTMIAAAFIGLSRLGYDEFAVIRRGDLLRMYEVPVLRRSLFGVFIDLAITLFAVYATFVLKYDDWRLVTNRAGATWLFAVYPLVCLAAFASFGVYRRVWRAASVEDLVRCSSAATAAAGVCAILSMLFNPTTPPVTWFATCYLVTLAGLNGSRASYRLLLESSNRSRPTGEPVLIYGAGRAGTTVVRELLSRPDTQMRPVGFIDDDPGRAGRVFYGYPVLGSVDTLETLVPRHGVRGVVIATAKLQPDRARAAALICERNGIWMRQFRVRFEERNGTTDDRGTRAHEVTELAASGHRETAGRAVATDNRRGLRARARPLRSGAEPSER
jgi:UDP-GlcNAc:undecaprenyl-phosphate GlcNAc-1-phosphate transferase